MQVPEPFKAFTSFGVQAAKVAGEVILVGNMHKVKQLLPLSCCLFELPESRPPRRLLCELQRFHVTFDLKESGAYLLEAFLFQWNSVPSFAIEVSLQGYGCYYPTSQRNN